MVCSLYMRFNDISKNRFQSFENRVEESLLNSDKQLTSLLEGCLGTGILSSYLGWFFLRSTVSGSTKLPSSLKDKAVDHVTNAAYGLFFSGGALCTFSAGSVVYFLKNSLRLVTQSSMDLTKKQIQNLNVLLESQQNICIPFKETEQKIGLLVFEILPFFVQKTAQLKQTSEDYKTVLPMLGHLQDLYESNENVFVEAGHILSSVTKKICERRQGFDQMKFNVITLLVFSIEKEKATMHALIKRAEDLRRKIETKRARFAMIEERLKALNIVETMQIENLDQQIDRYCLHSELRLTSISEENYVKNVFREVALS